MKRRDVLKKGSAAIAGFYTLPSTVLGANDRIRVAIMGCGRVSHRHLEKFSQQKNVEIVAVCDVHDTWLAERKNAAKEVGFNKIQAFKDYRKILEINDLNVLVNSTPDHWHALPTIEACQMGLDVYVEKPLSHNIYEGRKMMEAARKYNSVVQMGTQQRSGKHFQEAVELIQKGYLGKISMVRCWNNQNIYPNGIGITPESVPPSELDWDMWLGPAPFRTHKLNYWNTHWIDIIQWAMGVHYPKAVATIGDKYYLKDDQETPDTIETILEYDNFICVFSNKLLNSRGFDQKGNGILFYGSDATMYLSRGGYEVFPEYENNGEEEKPRVSPLKGEESEQALAHVTNFINCVRNRKRPIADVEEGHYTTTAAHLANIALRSKQRIEWDGEQEKIVNHPEANTYLFRQYRAPWNLPL
jgi:predicted dehydrogenase